ncbi:MAG: cyclase family protein [Clostridiaceae bacterium]|nr:cyclase family protein [Clostridiaceae bacterium]
MEKLIDLSQIIDDNMPVYPGDIRTNLFQVKYSSVNGYNDHRLDTGMHAGTHIDSPMHITDSKEYIYEAPLESFIAKGCILDVRNQPVIEMKAEYKKLVKDYSIVLLYTGYDKFYGTARYYLEHPVVDLSLCKFLLSKNIKMLGIDMPSPDRYPFEINKFFFENRIFILENLTNLEKLVGVTDFEVIALPMRIKADSSMTRAIARISSKP